MSDALQAIERIQRKVRRLVWMTAIVLALTLVLFFVTFDIVMRLPRP